MKHQPAPLIVIFILSISLISGCSLFVSEEKPSFDEVFRNNTWYYYNYDSSTPPTITNKWEVGSVNNIVWNSFDNISCDFSGNPSTETVLEFEVVEDSLKLTFQNGNTSTNEVMRYSETEFVLRLGSGNNLDDRVFVRDCTDLQR